MSKLEISQELYKRLAAVRQQVRVRFEILRVPGASGDISGKNRLERVPALRKREFTNYLVGSSGEIKKEKAARLFLDFMKGEFELSPTALEGIRREIKDELSCFRESSEWVETRGQLIEALGPSRYLAQNSPGLPCLPVNSQNSERGGAAVSPPRPAMPGVTQEDTVDIPMGKTTGTRRNRISELCYVEAEWRHTNLGPDETRWLQLLLRFKHSYTRERVNNVELPINVHRLHVTAKLDGAVASNRDEWTESDPTSGEKIKIFEDNAWTDERPCYEIDNPTRNWPLSGRFAWFDLCEVRGNVGDNAILEISASIGGITILLPESITAQLDPDQQRQYETPELRLLYGWLRDREIPRSFLRGGGLYQLTSIELKKPLA